MRSLVTGAAGFIGSHVVRALLAAGDEVRALVRDSEPPPSLRLLPVDVVRGDVRDPVAVAAAVRGCDRVFHVAARYALWAPRSDEMRDINVGGTRTVLAASQAAGVSVVVHTSSVAALAVPHRGEVADEATPVDARRIVGAYKRSKYEAEAVTEEFVRAGLRVVIVNPSFPVGPGDAKPTPTGQVLVDFLCGRMPAYVDTGMNVVSVRDVAQGHVLAAEKGRTGERYILGGVNLTMREFLEILARVSGRTAPRLRLPIAPLMVAAAWNEGASRLRGSTPRLTLDTVRMARHLMFYNPAKAVRELGLPQTPIEDVLREAVEWYRDHGYAPGRATSPV
ncbi:MAG: hopanoid-associated sugar epimerase [Candidatus Bipolaricaulota bacterium]